MHSLSMDSVLRLSVLKEVRVLEHSTGIGTRHNSVSEWCILILLQSHITYPITIKFMFINDENNQKEMRVMRLFGQCKEQKVQIIT